jgi:hypothetical protein
MSSSHNGNARERKRMRKLLYPLIAAAAMAAAVAILAPPTTSLAQQEPRAADVTPVPYNPGMGDLMSILIQPRHVKLWLAGHQENWALAGYALKEIKQSFARIAAGIPHYKDAPVADLIESAVGSQIGLVDFAIKAGEPRQFTEQYGKLTAGCNSCHVSTGHPYIVIKVPDGAAFANQEFQPKR